MMPKSSGHIIKNFCLHFSMRISGCNLSIQVLLDVRYEKRRCKFSLRCFSYELIYIPFRTFFTNNAEKKASCTFVTTIICGQVKNSENSEIFPVIFKSEFSILAIVQNRKLGNKKTRNNISEVSKFSICHFFIFFFVFFINIFPGSFFYICNFSSTLYKYRLFISLTKYEFMCLCFDL